MRFTCPCLPTMHVMSLVLVNRDDGVSGTVWRDAQTYPSKSLNDAAFSTV